MAASPPKPPPSSVEGAALLQSLGYNQQLKRKINVLGNLALVLSDITPTASLLIVGTVVIVTAGTGSIAAYLIGCFLAINVALCMGELGSMFPVAGGLFSIVTRVLGKPIGFLAMLDYMGQAVFLPASVAVGIVVYISVMVAGVPSNVAAAVVMIVVTGVALFAIRFNAILTGFFLALELLVVLALAISGLVHLQQPLSIATSPVMTDGKVGFFFSSRRRHTRSTRDWSSDVCSSDLIRNRRRTCAPSPVPDPDRQRCEVHASRRACFRRSQHKRQRHHC